jgi:tRNA(Ile2)-agmatinylcytidine synthase
MQDELIVAGEVIHLGMDDIDSPRGGCTTHFASLLVEHLSGIGAEWMDYPNLVRLNPNIPYRTRGNGAVALRFAIDSSETEGVLDWVSDRIVKYVEKSYPNTNPGVVIVTGEIPDDIRDFAHRALWRALPMELAHRILKRNELMYFREGNGRGLIGALSSIGNQLPNDHTYEFLAYRGIEETRAARGVDPRSVMEMDEMFSGRLFSNFDPVSGRILVEPRGPDPVLFGLRGEEANDVISAADHIQSSQKVERWLVFRTNQGTNEHLVNTLSISNLRPYIAVSVEGRVTSQPVMLEGGHVVFGIDDDTGTVECAAYEPSGGFRNTIMLLRKGDLIVVQAGVRPASRIHGLTLNVEGIQVSEVAQQEEHANPICPKCDRRMKSAGRLKGFKCANCGHKDAAAEKIVTPVSRDLKNGYYLPPLSAQRHLTRPTARLTRHNRGKPHQMVEKWHHP